MRGRRALALPAEQMKLAATDFDGTFCPHGEPIPAENIEAVQRWQKAGHKFGICTGRGIGLIRHALAPYPELRPDYLVCNNGGVIVDGEGRILQSFVVPADVRDGMLAMPVLRETHHPLRILTERGMFTLDTGADIPFGLPIEMPLISFDEAQKLPNVVQISLRCDSIEEALATTHEVEKAFPGIVGNINRNYIDFNRREANKRDGVRHLLQVTGWQPEQVLFIGDDRNDLPAVEYFKGCTVATAADFMKEAASAVYPTVGDMLLANL